MSTAEIVIEEMQRDRVGMALEFFAEPVCQPGKAAHVAAAKAAPLGAGDVWTWTAIDGPTKLVISRLHTANMLIVIHGTNFTSIDK